MAIDTNDFQCVICKSRSDCFNDLSNSQLEEISKSKIKINYNKGETIRKQGSFSRGILYLSKGITKVYREIAESDQNSIVTFNTSGQMIGCASLFDERTAKFTVVAMTDCTVCCIEIDVIKELMHQNGEFGIEMVSAINKQNNLLLDFLISNNHKQLHGRLAEAILFLREHVFKSDKFDVSLSRKEFAEYTNMSTMSVVRILKSFKEDGLIEDDHGMIRILNVDKLEQLSRNG